MNQTPIKIRYAEPFYVLFDYLSPKSKKIMWCPDLARYTEKDRKLYDIIGFKGGRGGAKSHHMALASLIIGKMEKVTVLCCREIQKTISASVHSLLRELIDVHGFDEYQVYDEKIINKRTGSLFIFKGLRHNELEIKGLNGVDICWVEEGHGVSDLSLNVLEYTIRKFGSQIWISYNPFRVNDEVFTRFFKNPDARTYIRHINYDENPFFHLSNLPVKLKRDLQKVKDGDMTQDDFDWIWLGEPMGQDERALIKRRTILECINRPFSTKGNVLIPTGSGIKLVGTDPSGQGKDPMVLTMLERYPVIDNRKEEPKTIYLDRELKHKEIKKSIHGERIGHTIEFVDSDKGIEQKIDATNMQGYGEDLLAMGYNVTMINFGERAKNQELYDNARNEMAFELEKSMRMGHMSLLPCPQREKEMQAYLWDFKKRGKFYKKCLEEKAAFKAREKYSPNYFDSLALARYAPFSRGTPKVIVI